MERELGVFFHVFPVGAWRDIVAEVLDTVESSGLAQRASFVRIGLVQAGQAKVGQDFLSRWPWTTLWPVKHHHFEWPTLHLVWDWSQTAKDDALALYLHTKGVTNDRHGKSGDWRRMMLYFTVERWQEATGAFSDPLVGVAGCNLKDKQPKKGKRAELKGQGVEWSRLWHFAGNFWWARASALRDLPEPGTKATSRILTWRGYKTRLQAERWVAGVGSKRLLSLHQSRVDVNSTKYPRKAYAIG